MRKHHPLLAAACLPALALPFPTFAQNADAELAPVVVTATRQETRVNEVLADVTVIERDEIEKNGQGTIIDLLARQPGVNLAQSGGAGQQTSLYLRGANFNQTKVLIDGVELTTYDGTAATLPYVSLADVERVEILRGPASSLYGANAIGGVIQIFTKRGQRGLKGDAFAGYGSHDTFKLDAGVSGGDEHWRFRVAGNHDESDAYSTVRKSYARNKDADDDAYRNTGGSASFSFIPAQGHELGASYRANSGVAYYDEGAYYDTWSNAVALSAGTYDDKRYSFRTEQLRLFARNRILSAWESELSYGESLDKRKNYSSPTSQNRSRTKNRQWAWQNNVDLPLGRVLVAIERLKQTTSDTEKLDYLGNPSYSDAPEFRNTSALAGWTANAGNNSWQVNVRRDKHSEFGGKTTYGVSYGYRFVPGLRAHVGYATAFRAPSIVDLYRQAWGGNPDLKPEEAKNGEVGLTWDKGGHTVSALYYHNRIKNLIVWVDDFSSPYWGKLENVDKALLEGVTLAYRGSFGAWRVNASYDWLNARNKSHDAAGVGYERLARRARDKGVLGVAYVWRDNLETGAEAVAVGKRYDGNYLKTAAHKEVLGGYTLFNLTANYAFARDWRLEARLNNIFDKKYENVRYYNSDGGFNAFVGVRYAPK